MCCVSGRKNCFDVMSNCRLLTSTVPRHLQSHILPRGYLHSLVDESHLNPRKIIVMLICLILGGFTPNPNGPMHVMSHHLGNLKQLQGIRIGNDPRIRQTSWHQRLAAASGCIQVGSFQQSEDITSEANML